MTTTKTFSITSITGGADLGPYQGATPEEAYRAYCADVGVEPAALAWDWSPQLRRLAWVAGDLVIEESKQ